MFFLTVRKNIYNVLLNWQNILFVNNTLRVLCFATAIDCSWERNVTAKSIDTFYDTYNKNDIVHQQGHARYV